MRSTIAIVLGFTILFGFSLYFTKQINFSAEIIQIQLKQAEIFIQSNKWEEANITIDETYKSWTDTKRWWAIVLNHSTLNSIEISHIRLQQFAINKEFSLSLAELNTLIILLRDIPESEILRLNNVL